MTVETVDVTDITVEMGRLNKTEGGKMSITGIIFLLPLGANAEFVFHMQCHKIF